MQFLELQALARRSLLEEFGSVAHDRKVEDAIALGPGPFAVATKHRFMLDQVRTAFISGAYYPALAGAASLGELVSVYVTEAMMRSRGMVVRAASPAPPKSTVATDATTLIPLTHAVAGNADFAPATRSAEVGPATNATSAARGVSGLLNRSAEINVLPELARN
jgi:hypothetical protein